jgi:hypothetical protein
MEQFADLIYKIKDKDNKLNILYKLTGASFFEFVNEELLASQNLLFKLLFNDDQIEFIEWWLYEEVDKIITIDNTIYNIEDIKDFYKFLKNNV